MSQCSPTTERTISVHHIPVALGVIFPVTFLSTYLWAVLSSHVPFVLPYISDTGAFAPESCFFGEMLNIGALLICSLVLIRHAQIDDFHRLERFTQIHKWSRAGAIVGLLSAFGITLVANFQEPNQFHMHAIGAILVFGVGNLYMWIEVRVTHLISRQIPEKRSILFLRIALAIFNLVSFLITIVTFWFAFLEYRPRGHRLRQNWWREDGGYDLHVVSAFFEWVTALAQIIFFVTYVGEFRGYKLTLPKLVRVVPSSSTAGVGAPRTPADAVTVATVPSIDKDVKLIG